MPIRHLRSGVLFAALLWLAGTAQAAVIGSIERINGTDPMDPVLVNAPPGLIEDALAYVDRTHQWNAVPAFMAGSDYVEIANDDRSAPNFMLQVTLAQPADLFFALDTRVNPGTGTLGPSRPWMFNGSTVFLKNAFVNIGVDENGDGSINNYNRVFVAPNVPAGTYTLFEQNQGGTNMYLAAARPAGFAGSAIRSVARTGGTSALNPQIAFGPTAGLAEDSQAFVDRTHQWNNVPALVQGAEYVLIANDDKAAAGFQLDVTLDQPSDLYLLLDNRTNGGAPENQANRPWMFNGSTVIFRNTFVDIGMDEGADGSVDNTSQVFIAPNLPAGTYRLYDNSSTGNMYGVAATAPAFVGQTRIASALRTGGTDPLEPQIVFGPTASLAEDSRAFVDRTHQWNAVPALLQGAEYVMLANDDRSAAGFQLQVTLEQPSDLYLMLDTRVNGGSGDNQPNRPWMFNGSTVVFQNTFQNIGVDEGGDGSINNYNRVFIAPNVPAGTYTLFEQNQGSINMYGVAATAPAFVGQTWLRSAVRSGGTDPLEPQVAFGPTASLAEDSRAFVDRTHQWNAVPAIL